MQLLKIQMLNLRINIFFLRKFNVNSVHLVNFVTFGYAPPGKPLYLFFVKNDGHVYFYYFLDS